MLNLRTLLLSLGTLSLFTILLLAVYQRPAASLKISVSHTVSSRILKDGNRATFFNAWVNNRSNQQVTYRIEARAADNDEPLILKGQTSQIDMNAGENRRIDFILVTPVPETRLEVEFVLLNQNGAEVALSEAFIKKRDHKQ